MSLTLIELATAIEQGKTIEMGTAHIACDDIEDILHCWATDPHLVRIKPEPREFFILQNKNDPLDIKVRFTSRMAQLKTKYHPDYEEIHVKEVL